MKAITKLEKAPCFSPIVSDFYSGMLVTVPLFKEQLNDGFDIDSIRKIYSKKYNGELVRYSESIDDGGFIAANAVAGKDSMTVSVSGNEDRILLTALYDNLGKGASGAAIQCMNMVMGIDKTIGLEL
jgi:N-acetyl-gamma-glutamyl-phosphate reductase